MWVPLSHCDSQLAAAHQRKVISAFWQSGDQGWSSPWGQETEED